MGMWEIVVSHTGSNAPIVQELYYCEVKAAQKYEEWLKSMRQHFSVILNYKDC